MSKGRCMCSRAGSRFAVVCAVLTANALFGVDSRVAEITPLRKPRWPNPPVEVDLKQAGGECARLEFSPDGQFLCTWWLPDPPIGDYNKLPGRAAVFDMRGRPVPEATDASGELTARFTLM